MIANKRLIGSLIILAVLFTTILSSFTVSLAATDTDVSGDKEVNSQEVKKDGEEPNETNGNENNNGTNNKNDNETSGDTNNENVNNNDDGETSGDNTTEPSNEEPATTSGDVKEDPVENESGDNLEPETTSGDDAQDVSGEETETTSGDDNEDASGEEAETTSGDNAEDVSGEEAEITSGEEEEKIEYPSSSFAYIITIKTSKGGKVSPHKTAVSKGKSQEYTFVPEEGYTVSDVILDGKSLGRIDKYTLENVREKHTLEVVFSQSSNSDWASAYIDKALKENLIPASFGTITPDKTITREQSAELAVKLYEKLAGKAKDPVDNPFKDTQNAEVLKAYSLGITLGTSEDTFSPEKLITREQLVTMFGRAVEVAIADAKAETSGEFVFDDDSIIHEWAKELVYFLQSKEIVKGIGENLFDPRGISTMEQAIVLAVRCLETFSK